MTKVLFLDRDGVINEDIGYLHKINQNRFIDSIFDICLYFQSKGYKIVVITNQSGIGRKLFSLKDFEKFNTWMLSEFRKRDIEILDVLFCPHSPEDNCGCRKPLPGMFHRAIKKYNVNISQSWLIGDSERDITAALSSGIENTVLLNEEQNTQPVSSKAKYIIKSLSEIMNLI